MAKKNAYPCGPLFRVERVKVWCNKCFTYPSSLSSPPLPSLSPLLSSPPPSPSREGGLLTVKLHHFLGLEIVISC